MWWLRLRKIQMRKKCWVWSRRTANDCNILMRKQCPHHVFCSKSEREIKEPKTNVGLSGFFCCFQADYFCFLFFSLFVFLSSFWESFPFWFLSFSRFSLKFVFPQPLCVSCMFPCFSAILFLLLLLRCFFFASCGACLNRLSYNLP